MYGIKVIKGNKNDALVIYINALHAKKLWVLFK